MPNYGKKRWHRSSCSKKRWHHGCYSKWAQSSYIFHVSTAIIRGQIFLFQKRCLICCCSKRDFTSAVILRWMDFSMASCYGPVLEHSTAVLQWTKWTREYNRNHLLAVTLLPLYSFNHSNYKKDINCIRTRYFVFSSSRKYIFFWLLQNDCFSLWLRVFFCPLVDIFTAHFARGGGGGSSSIMTGYETSNVCEVSTV